MTDTPDRDRRRERARRFLHPLSTKEQRAEIARRYTAGESMPKIARALGLKETTVRGYCPPRKPYT